MRKTGLVLVAAAIAATATVGAEAATPLIIGGTTVSSAPWGAQVYWDDDTGSGGFECSGTIIAPQWVLTAQHCLNSSGMHVKVGSVTLGQGVDADVDKQYASPDGDIALLHLATTVSTTYVQLADSDPATESTNQIYGWGRTQGANPPSSTLKTADVRVTGTSTDAYGGPAIASRGVTGSSWHGDSGGPELANGKQVGVCSTGDNTGYQTNGTQDYAKVSASRSWIRQTAGV